MARVKARPAPSPRAALAEYRKKRDFSRTPEPEGGSAGRPRADRTFVVQKHAATRLHYDFRLELEGTLKSWAVPKGPSLDPLERRLAMHVEDHPIEYGGFEGIIPKGEYGGGTVLLWDRGTWEPEEDPHKGYHAGSLKFTLRGEKLKGSWALVRINDRRQARDAGKSWLLIKHRDAEARPAGELNIVEARPESVATGRSMEEIAAAGDRVWHSKGGGEAPRPGLSSEDVPGAQRGRLPKFVPPQLATLAAKAPRGEEWLHELKFDGYRILARLEDGRVRLMSRTERDWTAKFPAVAEGVARLPAASAMLDGEVAVFLPDGTTSFQALQNAASGEDPGGRLTYMAFDLVHLDGWDLTGARLEDRKALLERLLKAAPNPEPLKYSDHVIGAGPAFFAQACRLGLEGIVSKRRDALYRGARMPTWLKIKCVREQEVVIGGYTDPEGSRVGIGAVLAGVYEGDRLVYAGKVGTGFSDKTLRTLHERLRALEQDACPFTPPPTGLGRPHWVTPSLVAQVTFGEWTADGRMRHPSFQGLREDKPAKEVVREMPTSDGSAPPPRGAEQSTRAKRPGAATRHAEGNRSPAAEGPGAGKRPPGGRADEVAEVAGVRLTHANRVVYPSQGVTKRDLAVFYESICDWILPHLAGRPTSLVRCPEGLAKDCFYQKHAGLGVPEAIRRVKIRERSKTDDYLVIDTRPALISLVQIGILEIHTWNSVVEHLERPDRVVFDLDPAPDVPWPRVIAAARLVRRGLEALGLESFVKTTGGKGLHVVVPLASGISWAEGADFTRAVAETLAREDPRSFIARMSKAARTGKIFIDHFRNARGATSVAAYSTRAKPTAPVSVPLDWDELSPRLRSDHYTVANLPRRLAGLRRDPWERYWTVRQELPAAPPAGRS